MTEKVYCPNTTDYEERILPWDLDGRPPLLKCAECGRISRTRRRHQVAGKTTKSHDKTMASLWAVATEAGN